MDTAFVMNPLCLVKEENVLGASKWMMVIMMRLKIMIMKMGGLKMKMTKGTSESSDWSRRRT